MTEIIITSSILILIVLALRFLLRGKLSPMVIYALWAIVALRLMVPFSIAETRLSIMNLFEHQEAVDETIDIEQTFQSVPDYMLDGYNPNADADWNPEELPYAEYEIIQNERADKNAQTPVDNSSTKNILTSTQDVLLALWLTGAAAVLGYALFSNLTFWLRLKNSRELLYENTFLPIYIAEGISTPCLFGVIRPGIYLNEFAAGDRKRAEYIINHEYVHYSHRDHIWALVRVVCVSVYWFNPLVWIAASISRQDSELACDSAVVKAIGEEHRLDYGRTLVDMMEVRYAPANVTLTVTSMNSGVKSIKERISTICRNPKTLLWSAITVCVVIVAAFVVTFTGAAKKSAEDAVSDTDISSSSDVLSTTDAEPEYLPFIEYPSIEIYLHEQGSEECTGFAAVSTLEDLDYITHVLKTAEQYTVSAGDMDDSWVAAELCVDMHTDYKIANDGYVIMKYTGSQNAFSQPVTVQTDNIAGGEYHEGCYGFYKIPDDMVEPFLERLNTICQEHQIRTPDGVGVSMEPKEKLNVMLYDGVDNHTPVQRCIFYGNEQYHIIHWLMRTEEWEEVGLEAIPDSKIAAHIYYDDDFSDHFYIMSDGYVIWKYLGNEPGPPVKSHSEYANEYANGVYHEGYIGGYRMPKDTLNTLLTVIGEIAAVEDASFYDKSLEGDRQVILDLLNSGSCRMDYLDSYVILDSREKIDDVLSYLPISSIPELPRFDSSTLPEDNRVYESCYFSQTDTTHITYGVSMQISISQYAAWMTIPVDDDEYIELELTNNTSLFALMHYFTQEHIAENRTFVTGNGYFDALFCSDISLDYRIFAEPRDLAYGGRMFCGIWELFSDAGSWTASEKPDASVLEQGSTVKLSSIAPYSPPDCMMTVYADAGYIQLIFKSDEQWYYVPDGLAERCDRIEDVFFAA